MIRVTRRELDVLCAAAESASREIMSIYGGDIGTWQKDDCSPITVADVRADAAINRQLAEAFPGIGVLSEESSSIADAFSETFFLVDPLDGTKEFLKRNGEFTVNIALVHGNVPIAGVVLAPAKQELFFAAGGLGAFKRSQAGTSALSVAPWQAGASLRVTGSRSHGDDNVAAWRSRLACSHTFAAVGSSLKFCHVAQGLADVYPRFGPTSQWDTAAAQCILEQAGGAVLDLAGSALLYGLNRPLLNTSFVAFGDARLRDLLFPMETFKKSEERLT